MRRHSLFFGIALASLVLGACALPRPTVQPEHITGKPGPDKVILVGRVELNPPLGKREQFFESFDVTGYYDMHRQRAVFYLNSEPAPTSAEGLAFNPELGKLFAFEIPSTAKYVVGGYVMLRIDVNRQRRLRIPLGLALDLRASDRAIYMGDIKIERDEFDEVTKIEILDHYASASAEFARRDGGAKLRKAIAKKL